MCLVFFFKTAFSSLKMNLCVTLSSNGEEREPRSVASGVFFLFLLITAAPVLPSSQDFRIRDFEVGEPMLGLDGVTTRHYFE